MSRAIAQRWTGTRALAAWIACLSSLSLGQSALAQVPLNGACLGDSCPTPAGVTTRVRTWVSGVGDDANTCGRVDPCKTLAAALSMTIGGGEVDILDPGDFGSAIITSSVTIDGRGGGRAALGGAGTSSIVVNAGPSDVVILRNLSLNSEQGLVLPPITNGITFVSGRALVVENSIIRGFAGRGIDFEPATGGSLFLRNVVTRDNGRAGVYVASTSPSQAFATIVKSRSIKNWNGFRVAGNARMSLYRSTASQNTDAGLLVAVTDTSAGEMNAEEMVVTENAVGVRAETSNGTAFARLSKTLIIGNTTAPTAIGGTGRILSFANNRIVGGSVPGCVPGTLTFTPTTLDAVTAGAALLNVTFSVNGAMGRVMFTENGALPSGLTFIGGTLTGIPNQAGTFPFTVTATDDFNCVDFASYQLVVNPAVDVAANNTTPRPNSGGCSIGGGPLGLGVLILGLSLLRRRKARAY